MQKKMKKRQEHYDRMAKYIATGDRLGGSGVSYVQ
jgi:hypothetical protein